MRYAAALFIAGALLGNAVTSDAQESSVFTAQTFTAESALRDLAYRAEIARGMEFPSGEAAPASGPRYPRTFWGASASPPTVSLPADLGLELFEPPMAAVSSSQVIVEPDVGQALAYFTSSRLLPLEADLVYPYRTVGKLLFDIPGKGTASCTATVVARRIILTAGHCVHSGTASPGWFSNFVFLPSFRDGNAPYGAWPAAYGLVTTTWATGQGKPVNAADYALLELADLTGSDGKVYRVGNVVGWLGFQVAASKKNHVTMLGYPGNLDSGQKMHQVSAFSLGFDVKTNTVAYGSDMMQGSSGGPWIQNFGALASGQVLAGGAKTLNRVVGVTSFGSTSPLPKLAASSVFDSRLTSLYNAICKHRAGNC